MKMNRLLLLAVAILTALFTAGATASDEIPLPSAGVSAEVATPHVTANLILSQGMYITGQPLTAVIHLKMEQDWHTYWVNPGEAGLATRVKWTFAKGSGDGIVPGDIQWPSPEIHAMGPIVTYGYAGDVYLPVTLDTSKAVFNSDLGQGILVVKATVKWLVCKDVCVPGKADLSLQIPVIIAATKSSTTVPDNGPAFMAQVMARMPKPAPFTVKANYGAGNLNFELPKGSLPEGATVYFFSATPSVVSAHQGDNGVKLAAAGDSQTLTFPLDQNGEKPEKVSGVFLVNGTTYYAIPETTIGTSAPSASTTTTAPTETATAAAPVAAAVGGGVDSGFAADASLTVVIGSALVGGLILNLMPCVLPVISLKVYALLRHAQEGATGGSKHPAWPQGLAFTAGVIVSFWVLAAILLIVRAAGRHVGWGYQLSSPLFVLFLVCLFFVIGLNLLGVFDVGGTLVGVDAQLSGKFTGTAASFWNGALATLASTPCSGPFMASSLGFAAQQSDFVAMLIFTSLAFGMALPFLLLTIFPKLLKFLPKPGAWMESFRQFLGFLMLLTTVFFAQAFSGLVGNDRTPWLLTLLVLLAMGAWVYGRWLQSSVLKSKTLPGLAFAVLLLFSVSMGTALVSTPEKDEWHGFSADLIQKSLKEGKPVFVDFTASWCINCKANELVAFSPASTQAAFADKHVVLVRADWSREDPEITEMLQKYKRDGVPLYLLFSPKNPDQPEILPQILTPGLVQDAVNRL